MINKYSLSLLLTLCVLTFGYGQIYTEDFTGQNSKGAIGPNPPTIDLSGVSWNIDISSSSLTATSDWFRVVNEVFEAQDVDGNSFWFSPSIDISAHTNVNFQISASEDGTMEAGDLIQTTYRINGGAWTQATNNGFLTDDFTSATVSETGLVGNTLEIRVRILNNAGGEFHRIDNIIVDGTPTSTDTRVQFTSSTSTLAEDGLFIDVCASITNPSLLLDTTVEVNLDGLSTATNGTDYDDGAGTPAAISFPQTLTFPANDNSDQCLTIFISNDDTVQEPSETVVLNLSNPSGGTNAGLGSTTQHTLTITDNDLNDNCATAIPLTVESTCNFQSFSNVGATDSSVPDPSCQGSSGLDVWFSTVVPASGEITIETEANGGLTDTILTLYSGTCASLLEIDCDDDGGTGTMSLLNNSELLTTYGLSVGDIIYIRVSDYQGNNTGTFNICVTSPPVCTEPLAQPTNLVLTNATSSTIDGSFTASGSADNYLVIASTSNSLSANPVDATSYTIGDALGGGTVVAVGNATTFTATGLTDNTTYYFFVFAFNNESCGGGPDYLTSNPLTENESTLIGPCLGEESFEGSWAPSGWTANGSFQGNNGGSARTGSRYAAFNDVGDWLELPTVDNPTSLQYYARLSSNASGSNRIAVQYFDGTNWIELDEHTATVNTYQLFTTDLTSISVLTNVRLRLFRTADDRSHYIDDLSVFCGSTITGPELQLVENNTNYEDCGFTYDFGSVSTSQTSTLDLEIKNLGNQDLEIFSLGVTGDFSVDLSTGFIIPVGGSQTFTITFAPGSAGPLSGVLTINSDDSDEGTCIVNLSGTGYIGTPEIRLETSNNNNIPDNLTAFAPVYDNTFAQIIEATVSAPKTYFIVNLGDGDLDISSVSLSNTEFTLVSNPADLGTYTLAPNATVPIEISFSPSSPGLKTATVTINNNDSDENPFNFDIRGTAICAGSTITMSPSSGPIGTIVTVTGANFGGGSTFATINGEVAPFNVLSATTMEVTIPPGADTAFLNIYDNAGCLAQEVFTVYTDQDDTCDGASNTIPSGWTNLLISGLFDNTGGSCHYLELFNPTATTIDLSTYSIRLSNNKSSANYIDTNNGDFDYTSIALSLSGSVDAYSTYMVQFGNTGSSCSDCPNIIPDIVLTNGAFGVNGIGSDGIDRLVLLNGSNEVDLWANSEYASSGFVYTRDVNATAPKFPNIIEDPSTPVTDYIVDSDGFDINDWNSQGNADCFGFSVPPFFDVPSVTGPVVSSSSCNIVTLTVTAMEGYDEPGDTRELDFDWYVFDPSSGPNPTWQLVLDGGIYSGADTAALSISDASNVLNYQFYCRVKENDATCYNASNAVIVTLPSTIWDGTSWSSPPNANTVAIINADYNTTAGGQQTSFEACNLIINNGATLTIGDVINGGSNTYVEVTNNVYVYGSGEIIVQPQAAFVQINDSGTVTADNPDNIQVNKRTAPMDIATEYTYWSSPVEDETIGDALVDANPGRRFLFSAQDYRDSRDETNNTNNSVVGHDDIDDNGLNDYVNDGTLFDWQLVNATTTMLKGVGYASTHSPTLFNQFPCNGGPNCQFNYTFQGLFNNGVIEVEIFKNDEEMADNNWNFVGNPYPSAISADAFLNYNSDIGGAPNRVMTGAIYLWSQNTAADSGTSGNEAQNFSQSDYAVINGVGQTGTSDGGEGTIPTRFIPSGQGFFIAMSNTAVNTTFHSNPTASAGNVVKSDLIFNNSMRVRGATNNSQFFRVNTSNASSRESNTTERLWLNLSSDNGIFSQVLVGYNEGATDDFDGAYFDAQRNIATGAFAILYTTIENSDKKFVIQGKDVNSISLDEIIPLGFSTSIDQATLYTISIPQIEGEFLNTNTIYIKDNLLDITHNLTDNDYTFTSEVGEFNERFEIVFNEDALSINENELNPSGLIISELSNGDVKFSVPSNFEMKTIEVIDLLGRTIYRLDANSSVEIYNLSALSTSTYIAKVTLSNGQLISKKAIKRK